MSDVLVGLAVVAYFAGQGALVVMLARLQNADRERRGG